MANSDEHVMKYNVHKEEPIYLLSLLDKYVKVSLVKDTSFNGFVHSIDPVTKSMILSVPNNEDFRTTLIPGHAIVDVIETAPPENHSTPPPRQESQSVNKDEILLRKNKLIAWFKKNLLPVAEQDENLVVGNVSLLPPYSVMDIYAEYPVVALKIRNIIEKMPDDFEI